MNGLILRRTFEALLPTSKVETELNDYNGTEFSIKRLDQFEYKALANFSLGTMITKGFPEAVDGIKTKIVLTSINRERTLITLETEIRIELKFILVFWFVIVLFYFFGNTDFPLWVVLCIFPLVLVWFWFIYRFQERSLPTKVETFLKGL